MSLPFTTHTVSITESSDSGDKWEPRTYGAARSGIPCVIANKTTADNTTGSGAQIVTLLTCYLNPDVPCSTGARITDEDTGEVYEAAWSKHRTGLNLDRREVGLRLVEGV